MDIKHTEITASGKRIEITGDRGSVKIVKENVQVNVASSKASAVPPADEMLSEEVLFTEAALVEPTQEKPYEETPAKETEEDSSEETLFTEAALVEPTQEKPYEETPDEEPATEESLTGEPASDKDEIKAIAGIEARKAGAVAAAAAQALAIAMEKRESGAVTPPRTEYDSFADLEAVERMAIDMVREEQESKSSSPAPETKAYETALAEGSEDEADAGEEASAINAGEAAETAVANPMPQACPGCPVSESGYPVAESGCPASESSCPAAVSGCPAAAGECPMGARGGVFAAEETDMLAVDAEVVAVAEPDAEVFADSAEPEAEAVAAAAESDTEAPETTDEAERSAAPDAAPQARGKASRSNATVRVIGVRFRTAGKVYYFDPGQWQVRHGTHVIVETVRGIEYGTVVGIPMDISAAKVPQPLKEVIRVATPEDTETERRNREKEREAYRVCQEKIRDHGLEMKLINAEYTFDNSKVLFYFTADGRVDFRDLVKDLASVFRTRIELRQIGVRDETKILGGYGICGRPLCCHTWMSDFIPVSIKMAKEQNLSLNPGKISGVCGRLMCCLKNESDTYEELNRSLPKVGDEVQGSDGLSGQVESVNVLRQTVRILVEVDDEKEYHEYNVGDITVTRRRRRGGNRNRKDNTDPKEAQELERLENQERQPSRGRGNRGNRDDRRDRNDGGNREDRGNRQDRGDGNNGAERRDRNDGGNRDDRRDRSDGGNREDRGNRQYRGDGNNGAERRDRNDRRNNRRRNSNSQSET